MTRTEVAEMIEFAMICYPHVQIKEMKKTLDVWTELFAGVEAGAGMRAMKGFCRESKYFPSVAEVMTRANDERELL